MLISNTLGLVHTIYSFFLDDLVQIWPELAPVSRVAREHLEAKALYSGYIERQARDIEAFRRDEGLRLPENLDYSKIGGISNEAKDKLMAARPATLGQASRIEGVTPGALTALLAFIRKKAS